MRATELGRVLFAVSMAAVGIISVIYHDYAMYWQPVPAWVPWHKVLATLSGALLVASGVGMLLRRFAATSTLVMALFLLSWLLLLRLPPVIAHPAIEEKWLGLGETSVMVAGVWALYIARVRDSGKPRLSLGANGLRYAQLLFGIALLPIGLSHIVYVDATSDLIPHWIPAHRALAYFTGAADIAAGLAIIFGIVPRLAATLDAVMLTSFGILVWALPLIAGHSTRLNWTAMWISFAIAAAAWAIARSYARSPWAVIPRLARRLNAPLRS